MAKLFRSLKEAISHAAVHGKPHGTRCALGGATHYQSGNDGPDEGEALVVRTIVHSVAKGDPEVKAAIYRWAQTGGVSGDCTNHRQEVLRKRLRRAGVLAPAAKRVRLRRVRREYADGEVLETAGVDAGNIFDKNQ